MSGDSEPLALPLWRLATSVCEVTTLYRELRQPLLRYLVCLGLSADEAQDVVQDAFLMLHRHVAAGGSKENVRGWVFRVAHNGARNRQKGYERRFAASLGTEAAPIALKPAPEPVAREEGSFRCLGDGNFGLWRF